MGSNKRRRPPRRLRSGKSPKVTFSQSRRSITNHKEQDLRSRLLDLRAGRQEFDPSNVTESDEKKRKGNSIRRVTLSRPFTSRDESSTPYKESYNNYHLSVLGSLTVSRDNTSARDSHTVSRVESSYSLSRDESFYSSSRDEGSHSSSRGESSHSSSHGEISHSSSRGKISHDHSSSRGKSSHFYSERIHPSPSRSQESGSGSDYTKIRSFKSKRSVFNQEQSSSRDHRSRSHRTPDKKVLQRRDRDESSNLSSMLKRARRSMENPGERKHSDEAIAIKRQRRADIRPSTNVSMSRLESDPLSRTPCTASQKSHRYGKKEESTPMQDYRSSPRSETLHTNTKLSERSLSTQTSQFASDTLQHGFWKWEKEESKSSQKLSSLFPERLNESPALTKKPLSMQSSSHVSSNKRETKQNMLDTSLERERYRRSQRITKSLSQQPLRKLHHNVLGSSTRMAHCKKEEGMLSKLSPSQYQPDTLLSSKSRLPSHKADESPLASSTQTRHHEVKKEKSDPRITSLTRPNTSIAFKNSKCPKRFPSPKRHHLGSRSLSSQRDQGDPKRFKSSHSGSSSNEMESCFARSAGRNDPEKRESDRAQRFVPISFKALEEICNLEENKAMTEIILKKGRYTALLNSTEPIREDLFKLVIMSLTLILKSNNRRTELCGIIQSTSKQLLKNHFPNYITTSEWSASSNEQLLKIVNILKMMIQLNEDIVSDLGDIMYQLTQRKLEDSWQTNDDISLQFKLLEKLYQTAKQPKRKQNSNDDEFPPDDFRKLSVAPTNEEFKSVEKPFLRANVIERAYSNVDHYLDVQFRLLREDCFSPMRNNIRNIRLRDETEQQHKISFLFRAVKILHPVCSRLGGVYTIQIDLQRCGLQHIKWEKWKKLTHGSLVCLSQDAFENVVFATVENRDVRNLKYGLVDLRFQTCDADTMKEFIREGTVFQMMENEAFFEAYRHNLTVLQQMNDEHFPFKEYIVYGNKEIDPPKYLQSQDTKDNNGNNMDVSPSSALLDDEDSDHYNGNDVEDGGSTSGRDDRSDDNDVYEDSGDYKDRRKSDEINSSPNSYPPSTHSSFDFDDLSRPSTSGFTAALHKKKTNRESRAKDGFRSIHSRRRNDSSSSHSEMSSDDEHSSTASSEQELQNRRQLNGIEEPVKSQADEQQVLLNFSSIVEDNDLHQPDINIDKIPALHFTRWPTKEMLGLDDSQYRAFRLALTKQFALIQGPPGTGKTYVGLKIAHVLLDSMKAINDGKTSPILMVSYTNHALDQFLMGIKSKEGIVRVGGRSKEEKLNEFNLRKLKQDLRKTEFRDPELARERGRLWRESKDIERDHELQESSNILKESQKGVLSLDVLAGFMKREHYQCFKRRDPHDDSRSKPDGNANLLKWLRVERKEENDEKRKRDERMYDNEDFRRLTDQRVFDEEEFPYYPELEEGELRPRLLLKCEVICYAHDAKNSSNLQNHLRNDSRMTEYEVERLHDLFRLPVIERWRLYRFWRWRLQQKCQKNIYKCQEGYENVLQRLYEVGRDEDLVVLRKAKVIGMTTTCAARNRDLLQRIQPKIVLIEEAAEVLEAHILTSIPLECEHVILIGDHQQLRPSCNVHELSKKYKLSVSMFERLVKQDIPCERLSVQHRMRPEIAALMRHIYKSLENHESVETFPNVRGMQHNLFFLHHSHEETLDEFSTSYINNHEVSFLTEMTHFILQQGYDASRVTILTPYVGQMFALREGLWKRGGDSESVRISTIDNFQGEENDIILLSLVRSNQDNRAGFVNDINRACVALSRAREGLYVIGNFDVIASKSEIWKNVVKDVENKGCFGEKLPLACQRHQTKVLIEKPEDFAEKARSGGCDLPCNYRLTCGHTCTKNCHPEDTDHSRCIEKCQQIICENDHECPNLCGQECVTRCKEQIDRKLPCGHIKENALCFERIQELQCDIQCQQTLQCGHQCQSKCSQPCTRDCQELVKHSDWPCGHDVTAACSATPFHCPGPCGVLKCGHPCTGNCGECLHGRVHKPCKSECGRVLVCSHECKAICSAACPPCKERCQTVCSHSKCDHKCGEKCVPCKYECSWQCKHFKCTRLCGEPCNRRCDKPCKEIIKGCNHRCQGLCGETCICLRCDRDKIVDFSCSLDEEDLDYRKSKVRFLRLEDCGHIFAVSEIERWVDMKNTQEESNEEIQLKFCPCCKTPIRKTMRYNNIIKQQLTDIERVKRNILEKYKPTLTKNELFLKLINYTRIGHDTRHKNDCDTLKKRIDSKHTSASDLVMIENQLKLLTNCKDLMDKIPPRFSQDSAAKKSNQISNFGRFISIFTTLKYLCTKRILKCKMQREIEDINLEIRRQKLRFQLTILQQEIATAEKDIEEEDESSLNSMCKQLSQATKLEKDKLEEHSKTIRDLRSKYNLTPLTQEEKDSIIRAMGLEKGHWFKCPQGHIYAIGECGGAMEKSVCPECKAEIGGSNHKLVDDNELAPEMDGARYAAWSEQANMANYVID